MTAKWGRAYEIAKTPTQAVRRGRSTRLRGAQPPHLTDGPVLTALTVVLALLIAAHQFLA